MKSALFLSSVLLIAAPAVHGERRGPISIAQFETYTAERFAAIDADGDERISSDEFNAADVRPPRFMRRGHHRHSRGDGRGPKFEAIDADGDGSISREELDAARSAGHPGGKPKRDGKGGKLDKAAMKERLFSRLDADEDGFVSQAEFNEPIERLRALDANGDGQVDRDERRSGLRKRGRG
ncbi:MAG: EF-hand domain-containing protein [Gammaproteobacteria bacterium]|nr:EF-hand domain-containing protein [Gammaproteobacteria bacterium]